MGRKRKAMQIDSAVEAAQAERIARCRREAARLILERAPPLIGQDVTNGRMMTADEMVYWGEKARFDFVHCALAFEQCGIPRDDLIAVVSCAGPVGPERMLAAWWECFRITKALSHWDEVGSKVLGSGVDALIEEDLLRYDASDLINGAGDVLASRRRYGREILNKLRDEIAALAKEA